MPEASQQVEGGWAVPVEGLVAMTRRHVRLPHMRALRHREQNATSKRTPVGPCARMPRPGRRQRYGSLSGTAVTRARACCAGSQRATVSPVRDGDDKWRTGSVIRTASTSSASGRVSGSSTGAIVADPGRAGKARGYSRARRPARGAM
ncbi:hypothetical protein BJP40_08240 [Streptomyces sp. CC53]|nr:hypothetical protein BJP40_08240 [Streptomyces sp. CC53]